VRTTQQFSITLPHDMAEAVKMDSLSKNNRVMNSVRPSNPTVFSAREIRFVARKSKD